MAGKMHLSLPVALAAVCSKAEVLSLLIPCLLLLPLFVGMRDFCFLSLFCYAVLIFISSFAIISLRKRQLV